MTLLALNGLRITEALTTDIEDLGHDRGHRILRIQRKGGQRAKVPLTPLAVRAIDTYIAERTTGPIFTTTTGRRLDRTAAYRTVRRLATRAGIPAADDISPHSLRHSFATAALDVGVPLRDVQDALATPIPAPPDATTAPATTSTATPPTQSQHSSPMVTNRDPTPGIPISICSTAAPLMTGEGAHFFAKKYQWPTGWHVRYGRI